MERGARRHVDLHVRDDHAPQLHLRLERRLLQQPPQVHPAVKPGAALQAADPHLGQASRQDPVSRGQPPRALRKEPVHEGIVGQHRRHRVLCLGRHEPEARHLPGTVHDGVVVGVHDADTEPGEPQVLGQAVDDVDEVEVAAGVFLHDLGDAGEAGLVEDGGGVDLVAD